MKRHNNFRARITYAGRRRSESFPTRTAAKKWLKRKSDKFGLTKNQVRICPSDPSTMEMRTHSGTVIRFAALDYPLLTSHTWYIGDGGYASTTTANKCIMMASLIAPPPHGLVIDHVNRIRHDNVRSNLRHVTPAENARNCNVQQNNTSGHNGIIEMHKYVFTYYDGTRFVEKGNSCAGPGPHEGLRRKVEAVRDRLHARTKGGKIPALRRKAWWLVQVCAQASDGGTKCFSFVPTDNTARQSALALAVAKRDRLQVLTGSTNGKAPG